MINRLRPGRSGGLLALGLIVLGLLLIGLGYNGVASNHVLQAQLPYMLSGGVLGLALVVIGSALLVTQSAREDRQRMEGVLRELLEVTSAGTAPAVPSSAEGLYAAGTDSYHQPGCRLVAGRGEVAYVTGEEARTQQLTACRVCQP